MHERIRVLLTWFGSGGGRWTGFDMYEEVPEELLLDYPTADVLAAMREATRLRRA